MLVNFLPYIEFRFKEQAMDPQGRLRRFVNRAVGRARRGLSRVAGRVGGAFNAGRGRGGIVNRSANRAR